jgi:hypothetical protein
MKRIAIAGSMLFLFTTAVGLANSVDNARAGVAAISRGDYAHAVDLFTQALSSGDLSAVDRESAFAMRAQAYIGEQRNDLALADLEQALKLDPTDQEVLNLRQRIENDSVGHPAASQPASSEQSTAPSPTARPGQDGWMKTDSGCLLWAQDVQGDETASWEGDCTSGLAEGAGTEIFRAGGKETRYEGPMRNGKRDGHGVATWANGVRYVGNFRDGKFSGHGVKTWGGGGRYDGDFRDGNFSGYGVESWANGVRYVGYFRDGKFSGHGVKTWADGDRYDGDFRNGNFDGYGVETWAHGVRYVGDFRGGEFSGHGVKTWAGGGRYDGDFRNGNFDGYGVETWANGVRYVGSFQDNKRNGNGVQTWPDRSWYEGEWSNDIPSGSGTLVNAQGTFSGIWKAGCYTSGSASVYAVVPASSCGH